MTQRTRTTLVVVFAMVLIGCGATRTTGVASRRGCFYYPWFGGEHGPGWNQQGLDPFTNYVPSRGHYVSGSAPVIAAHVAEMHFAGCRVGIASWQGRNTITDRNWPQLLAIGRAQGFRWAPYYEPEGISDPDPAQIADDLRYVVSRSGGPTLGGAGLATIRGRLVVFVYNADDATTAKGCATVRRWQRVKEVLRQPSQPVLPLYVDLKVFPGYRSCPEDPAIDGWHQYGPSSAEQDFARGPGDGSFTISPGYWKAGQPYSAAPFLARNRARWRHNIADMQASRAAWELITTYNEWGEGTAIEGSDRCDRSAPPDAVCSWQTVAGGSVFAQDLHQALPEDAHR